ncbi:MAG TPA: mucoidy inhibitor MuiA family protein [Polyangia bacterium]|nr:mucoidy inhibitor MuiA family protein [Polyangia bacterium]
MRALAITRAAFTILSVATPATVRAVAVPDAEGEIESVVVFPDRARVTRVRTVSCEGGAARAVFERLPGALDARTLRAEVGEAADVIGLTSAEVNETEAADPRARALAAERDATEVRMKDNEARRTQIAAELEDVGAFANIFATGLTEEMRNPKPDTPAWAKTLEALRARRGALAEERRGLEVALRGLKATLDRQQRELAQVGGAHDRTVRTATVTIGCRARPRVTAAVSYVLAGASWQPEYDFDVAPRAHAKAGPASVRLTVSAVIRQTTGEDWSNVRMTLSTARPKLEAQAPMPGPLVVDGFEQERGKVMVSARERRTNLIAAGAVPRAEPASVSLDDKGNAFTLTLPHSISVVADGRPVWAPVDVVEAHATIKLVAMPGLADHVFQVAALTNPAAYPLLAGRARSYRAGSYVGDTRLAHQGVGAPFEISLGIDDELKLERKTLDDKDVGAGIFSSTKHIVRAYRDKLTNQAAGAETIELREQIPVSKIDDVRVELLGKPTTGGYQLDAARGFVSWSVTLVRGEWRTFDLGYAIHLPESWEVSGR